MKDSETDLTSSANEFLPIEADLESPSQRFALLRKVGGRVLRSASTTGAIIGIANTLNPNLPPQYAIPASVVGGVLMDTTVDKLNTSNDRRKARKEAKKNSTKDGEITDLGGSVV